MHDRKALWKPALVAMWKSVLAFFEAQLALTSTAPSLKMLLTWESLGPVGPRSGIQRACMAPCGVGNGGHLFSPTARGYSPSRFLELESGVAQVVVLG